MGFTEILTLVFIVLKLTKIIDWSWLLVLLPELLGLAVYVTIVISQIGLLGQSKRRTKNLFKEEE